MGTPFSNYGLFHRRKPGRERDVDPGLISVLRGEGSPGNDVGRFSRQAVLIAVLASCAIGVTIGIVLFAV